ncbi:MAG: hypothetical protein K5681_00710 [Treponema sp.]|nr:hypothetical protein [Treponema sp.]
MILSSCASSRQQDNPKAEGLRIPFELDQHHHVILTFITDENIPVYFNFDSGCPDKKGIVTERGFKNLNGSDYQEALEERESFFQEHFQEITGKLFEEVSEEEKSKLKEKFFPKITTDFTPAYLTLPSYPEKRFTFDNYLFTYCPAENEGYGDDESDATIGFSFFPDAKRITFNYQEKYIEIDGPEICEEAIPLKYFSATGHYFAPVSIDGKPDYALLDTGSEVFTLREAAFDRQKMMELMDSPLTFMDYYNQIKNVRLERTDGQYNYAKSFTIGSHTWENLRALKITDIHMHTGALSKLIIASSNNIGYPFFKDKIIQFDLQAGLFRILE